MAALKFEGKPGVVYSQAMQNSGMQVVNLDSASGPVMEVLGSFVIAGALVVGAYLVLQKNTHLFGMRMTDQPLEAVALLQLYVVQRKCVIRKIFFMLVGPVTYPPHWQV